MNNNKYPDFFARRIPVKGTKDLIELFIKISFDRSSVLFELVINECKCDDHEMVLGKEHDRGVFSNGQLTLKGHLEEDIPVKVVARHTVSGRPEYNFYVGEQMVHREVGFPYDF